MDDLEELVKKAISEGLRTFLSCSHYRAIDYYLESITGPGEKCLHLAYECKTYDDFVRGVCGHCHDDSHLCAEMGFRANLYYYSSQSNNNRLSSTPTTATSSGTVESSKIIDKPAKGLFGSLTRGKRRVSVSGLDTTLLADLLENKTPEARESLMIEAKKKESLRLYYNTSKKRPFCREFHTDFYLECFLSFYYFNIRDMFFLDPLESLPVYSSLVHFLRHHFVPLSVQLLFHFFFAFHDFA